MKHKSTAAEVLAFWFGPPGERGKRQKRWFEKSDAFDREVRERFLPLYEEAATGKLAHLKESAEDCLALIVLLDQKAQLFASELFVVGDENSEGARVRHADARSCTTMSGISIRADVPSPVTLCSLS